LLGSGLPQEVGVWKMGLLGINRVSSHWLNTEKRRAWREGYECVWRQHGVWDYDASDTPRLLQPDYFTKVNEREVSFNQDYYRPFANRFSSAIRSVDDKALIFLEPVASPSLPQWGEEDAKNVVYAPHWYDGFTLIKDYSPCVAVDFFTQKIVFGPRAIKDSFTDQLASLRRKACSNFGGVPALVGEIGIPFNMHNKRDFRRGIFSAETRAINRSIQAVEANLLDVTLWNYTADNSNAHGDLWNDEDFSIFSRDQQSNPGNIHSGGRALQAVVRPYPRATAGELLRINYDAQRRWFEMAFRHDTHIRYPTELFIPNLHYPNGYRVIVSDGTWKDNRDGQMLTYFHDPDREVHTICIQPNL